MAHPKKERTNISPIRGGTSNSNNLVLLCCSCHKTRHVIDRGGIEDV